MIPYSHFKMKGLNLLKNLLRGNNFTCKMDLKDAYLCIPLHRNHKKISSISMEGLHLRVFMSMFWSRSSTSNFYKIIKDYYCNIEADSNQNNHLSGQHGADASDYKWSRNS